jgi:hypothetical protein
VPPEQYRPVPQALPQLPQLFTSAPVLMQTPLHSCWPLPVQPALYEVQVPALQYCPEEQVLPQPPQLLTSEAGFTQ